MPRADAVWPNDMMEAYLSFEQALIGDRREPAPFAARQQWLVRESCLAHIVRQPLRLARPGLPSLSLATGLGLIGDHMRGRSRRLGIRSNADALELNPQATRIRAFFLGERGRRTTLKVVDRRSKMARRMINEISRRRQLSEIGTIRTPTLRQFQEGTRYLCLEEAFVDGREFDPRRDCGIFLRQGLPSLVSTYLAAGVRHEPLSRWISPDLPQSVAAVCRGSVGSTAFLSYLERIIAADPLVPVGLRHGDIVPANLLVDHAGVYFLDWEFSGQGVLPFDVLKIVLRFPWQAALYFGVRRAIIDDLGVDPATFVEILSVYIALRILRRPHRAGGLLLYWRAARCWHALDARRSAPELSVSAASPRNRRTRKTKA